MLAKGPLGTLAPAKKSNFLGTAPFGELAEAAPLSSASKTNISPVLPLPSKLKCERLSFDEVLYRASKYHRQAVEEESTGVFLEITTICINCISGALMLFLYHSLHFSCF